MAIETIVTQILKTRRLTRQDQQVIMTEFSRENLSVVHRDLINKVYEALSQGWWTSSNSNPVQEAKSRS
jgi:hypothetical protein